MENEKKGLPEEEAAVVPEVTEPETVEPETTEPETSEPETIEPETTEPEMTEPETVESEATETETTEPNSDLSSLLDALSQEDDSYLEQETVAVKKPVNKLIVGIVIAAVVIALGVVAALWFTANPPRTGELGNSLGNVTNSALACSGDGWVYYNKSTVEKDKDGQVTAQKLGVERTNGKETQTVLEENATCLGYADNRLYYIDLTDRLLYRMNPDGSQKQRLTADQVASYVIKGDYLYYVSYVADSTTGSPSYTAYEMRLDGSGAKQISDADRQMAYLFPTDAALYYLNPSDYGLYKTDYNGGAATQVLKDEQLLAFLPADNAIYYIALTEAAQSATGDEKSDEPMTILYKAGANGENPQKLVENCLSFNLNADKLYYADSNYRLYVADADGKNRKKISDNALYPNVAGDQLYYMNTVDYLFYHTNLDGSDPRPIQ